MSLRRLTHDDALAWRDIRLDMLRTMPLAFGARFEVEAARPDAWFADRMTSVHVFGVFEGAEIIATAGWMPLRAATEAHRGFVNAVYTRQAHRGRGLLGQLLQAIIADARGHVVQLELTVSGGGSAHRAYARAGFVQTGILPRGLCHDGVYVDEVTMVLPLDDLVL
ncbi:MAG: GNAT family N-acetyltransferase [Pseudomonadota bacterium]